MQSLPSTLYTLQTFELAVDKARTRMSEIERILNNDESVLACQSHLTECQHALVTSSATAKDLELEVASLKAKIKEVNDLLYSGKIKVPKELTDRQDELEMLKRQMNRLDVRFLEAMRLQESSQEDVEKAEQALKEATLSLKRLSAELSKEHQKLDAEIKVNLRKRKDMLGQITKDAYEAYRKLRKKKNGQAVSLLHGNSCGLCGVGQTTTAVQEIKQADTLVYCTNCGRILVITAMSSSA